MKSPASLRAKIAALVAEGELATALEQLRGVAAAQIPELRAEFLVHYAGYRKLERNNRLALQPTEALERERRRLEFAVLEWLEEVLRRAARTELPVDEPAAAPPEGDAKQLEKVFGASQLRPVGWLELALSCARGVCRVRGPEGLGTGFLIGGDRILTNHHVLAGPDQAKEAYVDFGFEENVDGTSRPFASYRLDSSACVADPDVDVCVARVLGDPRLPAASSWGALTIEKGAAPPKGEHVNIIQHPGGGPKQIAFRESAVVGLVNDTLHYMTHTLPGSSGSPVFNDKWRVVAIHRASGQVKTGPDAAPIFANEGIPIRKALSALGLPMEAAG